MSSQISEQTSFGSTYMTLLGFAQVMHVTMPMQHVTDETSAVFKTEQGRHVLQHWEYNKSLPKLGEVNETPVT